jgi:diguanylate cyclase (GGDEF)-like protein
MFTLPGKSSSTEALLADSSDVEELRAQRVWQLVQVACMTWAFFTLFCFARGFLPAATICLAETVIILGVIWCSRESDNYRRIMNVSLSACAGGLLLVALTDEALHHTILYYPASILIASQLLGVRAAFKWMLVCLVGYVTFYAVSFGVVACATTKVNELTLIMGVAVCIFLCCRQGEAFYHERTRGLVALSQRLRSQGRHLQKLATTDSLTGLLNRFKFQSDLEEQVDIATETNETMALLLIDMDGFKEINDTLGHPVGDQALIEISRRLEDEFQDAATISRLGGDEFCLIFPNVGTAEVAELKAETACQLLTERYEVDEFDFPMGASIGIALCPDDSKSATDVLSFADTAMFFAKEKQLGFASYVPEMTKRLVEYRAMQEQLSHALQRDEFFLVYQPKVCLDSGVMTGVEALLRWRHGGEVISPVQFIPLLEKSREIIPVGRWIIREACRQQKAWSDAGIDLEVAINVSSIQFNDERFIEAIAEPITEFDIDPKKLDFEITESLLIDDVAQAVDRLKQIKQIGASVSIDDFGTGYSSLAYLRQFPLDTLKIDRAFVKDIPDGDDGVIAMSIVALSKAIGVKVLAEGVETQEQLDFLKSIDCDSYQGFFFSRPVAAEEITALVETDDANSLTL